VTLNGGAHLSPGASVGTLTAGGLSLASSCLLDFEFGSTASSDLAVITSPGGLSVTGAIVNVAPVAGFLASLIAHDAARRACLCAARGRELYEHGTTQAGTRSVWLQVLRLAAGGAMGEARRWTRGAWRALYAAYALLAVAGWRSWRRSAAAR